VIDTATNEVENRTIPVESKPRAVAFSPDGSRAYVANSGSSSVAVIDTATGKTEGQPIEVGSEPRAIAVTPDQPPIASFQASRARPGVPLGFDASASVEPDGTISTYAWDFGDRQAGGFAVPFATHEYATPGTYRVTLQLIDGEGCSTAQTFTGQTAACSGSASASATQAVKVAFPGVRVRCPKSAEQHGCRFKLQAVTRKRRGRAESAVARAKATAGRSAVVSLKPKGRFRSRLAAAATLLVKETVTIDGSRRASVRRLKVVR
jgi:YVTN family beta-propeller protein